MTLGAAVIFQARQLEVVEADSKLTELAGLLGSKAHRTPDAEVFRHWRDACVEPAASRGVSAVGGQSRPPFDLDIGAVLIYVHGHGQTLVYRTHVSKNVKLGTAINVSLLRQM
jgi:hypothetical protein